MKQKKLLVTFALGMCALTAAHAQDNDFDLGSQRSEVQLVNPVPGKKIDHQGLVINPTPRYVKLTGEGTVDVSGGVTLSQPFSKIKHSWDYWPDLNFLSRADKGFPMKIQLVKIPVLLKDGEQSGADVDGAYTLRITKKGITIWADNDLGVFYGIQTLRQIMENPSVEGGKKLPCLEIADAPVFAYRGDRKSVV